MRAFSSRRARAGAVVATVAGIASFGLVASATADDQTQARGGPNTISMVLNQFGPSFEGPGTVVAGDDLRVLNDTNPEQIGPHFFTITRKRAIPKTGAQIRRCNRLESKVCRRIANAHQVDNQFNIGKQLVDSGKPGWNKGFSPSTRGDSWFSQTENEEITQTVSARPGKTLSFFCAIHPATMRGKIKVIAPSG